MNILPPAPRSGPTVLPEVVGTVLTSRVFSGERAFWIPALALMLWIRADFRETAGAWVRRVSPGETWWGSVARE